MRDTKNFKWFHSSRKFDELLFNYYLATGYFGVRRPQFLQQRYRSYISFFSFLYDPRICWAIQRVEPCILSHALSLNVSAYCVSWNTNPIRLFRYLPIYLSLLLPWPFATYDAPASLIDSMSRRSGRVEAAMSKWSRNRDQNLRRRRSLRWKGPYLWYVRVRLDQTFVNLAKPAFGCRTIASPAIVHEVKYIIFAIKYCI